MTDIGYPDCIKSLSRVKIDLPGVTGWLCQGKNEQIVFFEIEAGKVVPPHSHGEQYGFVIDGEMELSIGGKTKVYKKGDSYHIPSGIEHHAKFKSFFRAMDFFSDVDRYQVE